MKSRLLNVAAALSLLLGVGIVILWVIGCWRVDELSRDELASTGQYSIVVRTARGEFSIWRRCISREFRTPTPPTYTHDSWPTAFISTSPPTGYPFPWPPLAISHYVRTVEKSSEIEIADWFLLLLTLPLPIIAAERFRRERRRRHRVAHNLCPRCGYNLRGTPDHCPECGLARAG